jgi:peptide/histidine transporter 3/4
LSETENPTPSVYTEDGTVDFRGNPAVRATTGGRKTAAILLGKPFFYSAFSLHYLSFL